MKIKVFFLVFSVIVTVFIVGCEQGNGEVVSKEIKASNFTSINANGSANVNIHFSEEYKVIVTTDSNIQDKIEIETSGNTLYIEKSQDNYNPTKLIIDVYMPDLKAVTLNGSGKIKIDSGNTLDFDITLSGSGNINSQNYEAQSVNMNLSGSGSIKLKAMSTLNANISGSGNINAQNFEIQNANVIISGSGNIRLWVTDSLKGKISGSGSIFHKGNSSINVNITGSGRVKPL